MAASKCNPEIMDLFRGIEFNYKLNSAISSLPKNQKFSAEQLENMLKKNPYNVSPYEIKASRLFDNFRGDNRTFTAEEWDQMNLGEQMFSTKLTDETMDDTYSSYTLNNKGSMNDSYRVKEFMTTKQDKSTNLRHEFGDTIVETDELKQLNKQMQDLKDKYGFKNILDLLKTDEYKQLSNKIRLLEESDKGYIKVYEQKSQLGWNRVHQDVINGKPSTVLNELQSDWLQAERQGAGMFESKAKAEKEAYYALRDRLETARFGGNHENLTSEQTNKLEDELKASRLYKEGTKTEIADFPMKPDKFHQLMIVDAINESIENGTNRVVIPIKRENELAGTEGVTKFYEGLDKQLKVIQNKLGKQGLELKIGKEDYIGDKEILNKSPIDKADEVLEYAENYMLGYSEGKVDSLEEILRELEDIDGATIGDLFVKMGEHKNLNTDDILALKTYLMKKNKLHTIEVIQKPNTPVKWDVYALISSLGLTNEAIELSKEEN
jgi:hypothetical protein